MKAQKEMCGVLFKAKPGSKRDSEGRCTIEGKEYWISGWMKQGQSSDFTSLSFRPVESTISHKNDTQADAEEEM